MSMKNIATTLSRLGLIAVLAVGQAAYGSCGLTRWQVEAQGVDLDDARLLSLSPEQMVARLGVSPQILTFRRPANVIPSITSPLVKARAMSYPAVAFPDQAVAPFAGVMGEIGIGSEVDRIFVDAGNRKDVVQGAESQHAMELSDRRYGPPRGPYVGRNRLDQMLDVHWKDITDTTWRNRPPGTRFFAFADTAGTDGGRGHAWLGVRFHTAAGSEPTTMRLHVQLKNDAAQIQQRQLGTLGINMIYGAWRHFGEPARWVDSLREGLPVEDINVDSVELVAPAGGNAANGPLAQLVVASELGTSAAVAPDGTTFTPSQQLYNKTVVFSFTQSPLSSEASSAVAEIKGKVAKPEDFVGVQVIGVESPADALSSTTAEAMSAAARSGNVAVLASPAAAHYQQVLALAANGGRIPRALRGALGSPSTVLVIMPNGRAVPVPLE